ncbi:MAG: Maf family protein [Pseudomonadota bacterium]|nr:Maf family protein [Pseudomonadota bacterium]MEC8153901.1 Maf family protein [Pseudomonadota bacterium]
MDDYQDFPLPPQLGWMGDQPLLLASASQTRMAMLIDAGLPIMVAPSDIDESVIKQRVRSEGGAASVAAAELAEAKAATVSRAHPGQITVGADQILVLEDEQGQEIWFDKPEDRGQAHQTLQTLSSKTHRLMTATAVCLDGEIRWSSLTSPTLSMRTLSDTFIWAYLDTLGDEALWSVGAYQLEGLGSQLFERVEGDFFTILGLDLTGLLQHFRDNRALLA